MMLACSRDIARMDREVRSGTWSTREGEELFRRDFAASRAQRRHTRISRAGAGESPALILISTARGASFDEERAHRWAA